MSPIMKICNGCRRVFPPAELDRGRCRARCAPARERARGTRQARGYTDEWLLRVELAIRAHPWCSYCGRIDDLTGDHARPLSRGGKQLPAVEEIVVACRSCNSSKGNRPAPAFLDHRPRPGGNAGGGTGPLVAHHEPEPRLSPAALCTSSRSENPATSREAGHV